MEKKGLKERLKYWLPVAELVLPEPRHVAGGSPQLTWTVPVSSLLLLLLRKFEAKAGDVLRRCRLLHAASQQRLRGHDS